MTYTKDFKEAVKSWYFENGECLTETARHFSIPVQYVYRWKDIEKQRERDRLYEKSSKRKAYLKEHKEERNAYLRAYRKTEAGREAEKRSAKKKASKTKRAKLNIENYILPFVDRVIDSRTFEYDHLVWKIGALGYIQSGDNYYHRYIYEKIKNKKINKGWQIHHIDSNKLNNDLNNLVCVPEVVHNYLHFLLRNKKIKEYQKLIKEYR